MGKSFRPRELWFIDPVLKYLLPCIKINFIFVKVHDLLLILCNFCGHNLFKSAISKITKLMLCSITGISHCKFVVKVCTWSSLLAILHCAKKNLNLHIKTEPVTAAADATVQYSTVCVWVRNRDRLGFCAEI